MKKIFPLICLVLFLLTLAPAPASSQSSPNGWAIVASWTIPGKASGLAWDGTYIYFGIYGTNGNEIYKFNPSNGTSVLQCTGPFDDAYGLTYKSPNLVTINQPTSSSQPSLALEFTMAGVQVSTITLPNHYMSGIAWDNPNYWVCTYYPDPGTVYKINSSGTVLSQFTPPNNQPWDICTQGADLWIADYNANMLYKVSNTGTLLESHASQGIKPAGVVYDGTYLWYCDGQLGSSSTLYKVDLLGTGTPAITVPVTSHDYGAVAIGNNSTWNCQVQNTGTANLTITGIGIPTGEPISTSFSTPYTLTPGSSVNIPLTYTPVSPIPLNTQVSINSNDPIHPSVLVTLTGNGVYAGPHISLPATSHDYGPRRAGAYTRWSLPVTNDGSQPLTISGLSINDPNFILDESISLPMNVPTLSTANIPIWFHPDEGIWYDGTLTISSNAVGQPTVDFMLEGTGRDTVWPLGTILWSHMITGGFDNSVKAIEPLFDITGDGVDEVIVGSEDNYVRCFNGNASATADVLWAVEIYSGSVYNQNSVTTIQDINLDGYWDVVIGTTGGDRSIIALSGKTGEQLWKHDTHEYGTGGWIYQVDARYDYNNDGFPDVLAATGNDGNNTGPRRVYCLNGKTGISIWEYDTGGPVFSVIGVQDFTGDNEPDVVAGASNQQETSGRVYGIDGTNGALKWTYFTSGTSVWGLMQIDDNNGDGKKDIAAGDFSGHIYFLNAVNGQKLLETTIGNVLILRLENMGDVNKDLHPDILVAHSGTTARMINGVTCAEIWAVPLQDKSWCVANIGDITWDGYNDAIIGTLYEDNYVYFLQGWDGEILLSLPTQTPVDGLNAIPDIVGDTSMEMVVGGRNGMLVCLSGGYDTTSVVGITQQTKYRDKAVTLFPNPTSGNISLALSLDRSSGVEVRILDLSGTPVQNIHAGTFEKGGHLIETQLNASLPSGVYFVEIKTDDARFREKLVLIR